jgi:hypothetical protein
MPGIKGISIPQAVKVIKANIAIKILIIVPHFLLSIKLILAPISSIQYL